VSKVNRIILYLPPMKSNKLNLFSLTMIVIGLVIGLGIFRTSSDAAKAALTPNVFFFAWVAGGIIALCGALTYAEIGSRLPVTGGYYKIFAECYHPSIAFAINCIILISNAASLSGVALIGSEYISQIIFTTEPSSFTKALIALIAVSFTYGGYQQTINFGEEVENPRKTIPRGIFIGILIIIALYLTISFAYYKIIGFEELKTSKGIAAIVAEKMFGAPGRYVISILLFLAVLAYVNVLLLSNPRVMYAMSMDGILPAAFKKKEEKKDVLTVSLTVFAAMCVIVLFFADTFDKILSFTIFLDSFGMAFSAATIFILRKRTKHLDGTGIYTMKLFPVMPVIFIAAYIFVAASIAISTPQYAIIGIGSITLFVLIYFISRGMKKQPT